MADLVIVNGPPGVGKTTVSRILAELVPGTVCIRGDELRAFAPTDAREHLGGGSTFRAAAVLAKAYLAMGAARVVVDYVFLRRTHVVYFRDALGAAETPLHMFTLWAPLDVVRLRERERVGRSPLGTAVEECWSEIERNRGLLGELVDTTTLDAYETALTISRAVERSAATR